MALTQPTRSKSRSKGQAHAQTVEEKTWPDEACVLSLMAHGFSYDDACHMSKRDYRRYTGLAAAWSIPEDDRAGVIRKGTKEEARAALG